MRDTIGGTMSRSQAEQFLNQWVNNYVIEDDNAGQGGEASAPSQDRGAGGAG